ncbi:hypothetical protein [Streptomyces sp. ACT015]|uniref:hypothetical protein n=1 Tax=Streptomyces sp. ACT015 TaxID=3134807 RepID=UPI003D16BE32
MSIARRLPRRQWLRAFVLLLALLVPTEAYTAPALTSSMEAEYGVTEAAARPAAHPAQRIASPPRPAPLPAPAPDAAAHRPPPAPAAPAPAPRILRSVVLRC